MKIIELQQNTPEWYEYRKTRIGASDFNAFCKFKRLYVPYYKSKDTLDDHFYNKINNVQFTNAYIEKGKELEPILLEEYNVLTGGCYAPIVVEYDENIFASLDGYDIFTDRMVEIKTTAKHPRDEIPLLTSYMFQCFHQMQCVGITNMVILINYYNHGITKHYHIIYDCKECTYSIYSLEKILLDIPWICWIDLCKEYLKLLGERIKASKS